MGLSVSGLKLPPEITTRWILLCREHRKALIAASWLLLKRFQESFWNLALLLGPLQDPLLDGSLADEAVDGDLLGLAQPVSPIHGLLVNCRVPVTVIEDDLVEKITKLETS